MIVHNQNNENNPDWLNCEKILLDSGCSHHMARESSYALDFVESCEGKLGYVCMGNGTRARTKGYGHKSPIGMVLIVPDLQTHAVYSIGTFTK